MILEHFRPYNSVDSDQPSYPLHSPAPLGTKVLKPEASGEDDAEMGATSRAPSIIVLIPAGSLGTAYGV